MSNELAVSPEFRALSASDNASALLEANLGGESLRSSDLTWVKVPTGGATRWSWQTKSGAEFSEKSLTGLLVVVGRTEQALWPQSEIAKGSLPLLVSTDGQKAYKVGSDYGNLDRDVIEAAKNDDGSYSVAKIPYFQWEGRGPGAKPPRAKSTRVVGILRHEDSVPVFVRVSSTSLRAIDDLLRGITADGIFHYRAVVELSLEKRKGRTADYAVIVAKKIGEVSEQDGEFAKSRFTDTLTGVVCVAAHLRSSRAVESSDAVPF